MKLLLFAVALGAYGRTFTISPAINYECTDGQAIGNFTWSGAPGARSKIGNTPVNLSPGIYRLSARLMVQGVEVGEDSMNVVIR
jgi:hypothetical protein